jgi:glutamyl-tRNA synthetase
VNAEVRVRFAPSPTGFLHVGGARTALFNWLFARHTGGKFILRIEDTDQLRSTDESTGNLVDALRWLGLDWDEGPEVGGDSGPYRQSLRRDLYTEWSERLLAEGKAYRCFCTPEELVGRRQELKRQGLDVKYDRRCREIAPEEVDRRLADGTPHVLRFRMPVEGETRVEDLVRGEVTFKNPTLDDFVIMKSDGFPTYNFAVVVDDAMMRISHIIRGDDHLSNTPKQVHLYRAFGLESPRFAHVPLIMGPDKTRLSKRHGATSLAQFRDDGYLPEALVNYLALLGWSYDGATDLFEVDDLISKFSLDGVSSTAAMFDYAKLQWMNGEYLKRRPVEDRVRLALPHLEAAGLVGKPLSNEALSYVHKVIELLGDRLKVGRQIVDLASYFFTDEIEYDPEAVEKFLKRHYVTPTFRVLEERLREMDTFDAPALEPVMRALASEMGLKAGEMFQPVRIALTGSRHSPGLFELMALLGKERVLKRLEHVRRSRS